MKYKLHNALICIDETCSVADIYISTTVHSSIERYEVTRQFLAFYDSVNACAIKIESPHITTVCGQTIVVRELTADSAERLIFSPITVSDQHNFSLLYVPGCVCIKQFARALRELAVEQLACFECRYLLKLPPRLQPNERLISSMASFSKDHHTILNYPLRFDTEVFLLRLCDIAAPKTTAVQTRLSYAAAPQRLREMFSLGIDIGMHSENHTAYFLALLEAHERVVVPEGNRLITILPLFEPETPQIFQQDRKMLIYYKAFMITSEIQAILDVVHATQLRPACAFGNESDSEQKERRLARLAKCSVESPQVMLNATERDVLLLKQAKIL